MHWNSRRVGLEQGPGRGPIGAASADDCRYLAGQRIRGTRRLLCALSVALLLLPTPIAGAKGQSLRKWCEENAQELPHVDVVRTVFPTMPVMLYVSCCESRGERGAKNKKSSAVGLFQILSSYWGSYARKHGHDLYSAEGNARVAAHIIEVQGLRAWNASKHCWQGQV